MTLFVVSDFAAPSLGFPYLEDAYVALEARELQQGRFYANFVPESPSYCFEETDFLFGGRLSCSLPYLDPLQEKHPIERLALLVAPASSLTGRGSLPCAFSPRSAEEKRLFPSQSFGAAKKDAYRAECASFLRYVDAMGLFPLLAGSAALLLLGAFAFASFREERKTMRRYARSSAFRFFEDFKLYGTLFLLPSLLGLALFFAIASALGYPFSYPMIGSVLAINALFAVAFPLGGAYKKEERQ